MHRWRTYAGWGIVLFTLGLLFVGALLIIFSITQPKTTVTIGSTVIRATVASTDAQQKRGLGGATNLSKNQGMLFVFDTEGSQPMWMKDMRISIDMIWLNDDKRVVHVERSVAPNTYPEVFGSPELAKYVLEVPAGTSAEAAITDGKLASFDVK